MRPFEMKFSKPHRSELRALSASGVIVAGTGGESEFPVLPL
jgi:hypothetical protein